MVPVPTSSYLCGPYVYQNLYSFDSLLTLKYEIYNYIHDFLIFRLTVVDTPGFGDAIDNSDSFQQIIRYIDDQFARYPYLGTHLPM